MPGPARKRQKTVHKVAELEKKINALTEALIAKNGANPTPPNDSPANDRLTESQSDITRSEIDPRSPEKSIDRLTRTDRALIEKAMPAMTKGDLDWGCSRFSKRDVVEPPYVDPIDRGLMEMGVAEVMFDHFVAKMLPFFPILSFPSYIKAQDVRAARPTLFLAILAVASSAVRAEMQPDLLVEINRQLSERILFSGEKSLELVQATLVYTAYYVRSKYAKDLAFNQYIHSAVVMCLDLGMGKRYPQKLNRDGIEEAEIRRTWLACYYFASSVSILLRHPSLVRWSPYVEECVHYLSTSPHALPSDAWLSALVKIQHIAEEVCIVFNMDDPSSTISFGDIKTQYHLKAFEKKLADWKSSVPSYMDRRLVEHVAASLNLYIHEISIHHDHNVDDFRPGDRMPVEPTTGSFITTVHIDALTTCLDSCHRVLNSYLALDLETARVIPNLFIVWNTYAMVGLIKLDGVLNAADSSFGAVFKPDLQVDHYLSSIVQKLHDVSAEGRWPPAEAFIFVMKKLTSWHMHKKAPWVGEDGNTQQPDTQQADASGLNFRSSDENKAADRVATSTMRSFPDKMGLPEQYGRSPYTLQGTVNQAYNIIGNSGTMGPPTSAPYDFAASQTSDLNAAFNAANYNINWDELNFSQQELNVFDSYMNDQGWMGYLI